ncbi:hypothetical protein BX616_009631 [Lobosporangium transversale]|uniref:Uncharacterized protein n=1 Tax=Lobosporangium transversale TaxID=64571 RepID=A0A1Y2GGR6_9FUNG|nr:hypothetical protein BCR41DRAFT_388078 [Lobosporangium transversale]KAF9913759.1 hypothetical protein BX616_009631 [Lobosporangium transversale]ORZ10349.1 hypothetical protein BCR41DRAFT_388078 [Lobosporangium transversale]|eukprot:XP_021879256.1 hypothetical protein BCR41DRAFT_388078 [Lobosporangium transversale]
MQYPSKEPIVIAVTKDQFLTVATALLALTAFVTAQEVDKRLVDISETELEVKEIHDKSGVDTFVVTVQRTDDLLADDGTFLAERIMAVAFNFDVQNHEVLLNNVPVCMESQYKPEEPITVTVEVEAGVIVGPALDPETKAEDLMNAFDRGLVTVQVTASTEYVTADDGSIIRRVTLQERIVEVNGHEITQTDLAQQIIEIMPDGTLGNYTPITFGRKPAEGSFEDAMESIDDWFRTLDWLALTCIGIIAMSFFVVSATTLRLFLRLLSLKRRAARYAKIQQEETSEDYVQVAIVDDKVDDEKKALAN